jgi:hypothetical protein
MAVATAANFNQALTRILFTAPARNAINEHGIVSLRSLTLLGKKDIATICKICRNNGTPIPFMQQQYLEAMRYWGRDRVRLGLSITTTESLALFTLAEAHLAAATMVQEEEDSAATDRIKPTPPEKFTRVRDWLTFKETFIAYLGQINGVNNIPLSYVVRTEAAPDPAAIYESDRERRIATCPLTGRCFTKDSETVFATLKELTLTGPA